MTNKYLLAVGGLVVGLVAGFFLFKSSSQSLGAVTPYNCLNQQILCNELTAISNPLVAIEQTSISLTEPLIAGNTSNVTTSVVTIPGIQGDEVLVNAATTTAGVYYNATVNVSGSSTSSLSIGAENDNTVSSTPGAVTLYVTILPHASFLAPTGL